MDMAEFLQKFFLLLLPGFAGMLLYNQLNIHEEQHYYLEVLKLICLSMVSYLLTDVLFWILGIFSFFPFHPVNIIQEIGADSVNLPSANVLIAIGFSLFFASLLTKANDYHWLFDIANRLSITRRSGNRPLWEQVFDKNSIVVLRDTVTSNTYYGKVGAFSDDSNIREILLHHVVVFNQSGKRLYYADSIYLSREHNQFTIEMENPTRRKEEKGT